MKNKFLLLGVAALVLLQAGRSVAEQSMREVRMVDADGAAIASLSLTVYPEKASAGFPNINIGAETDTNGMAHFELPRGFKYIVTADPSLDAPYFGTGIIPVTSDANGAKESPVTIQLRRCGAVHGQVVDTAGKPLSEVKVVWSSDGGMSYGDQSRSDGRFRIDLVREEGAGTVYGYNRELVIDKVRVDLGSASNLVLVAHKKRTLDVHCNIVSNANTGRVTVPYSGACNLEGPVGYMYQITNGEFTLPDLVPGDYKLSVSGLYAQGLYLTNSAFKVSSGTTSMDFVVVPLRSLSLVVKDNDSGRPISNATVSVEQGRQPSTPRKTDETGNVVLRVLPVREEGWVRINHAGYMSIRIALPQVDELIVRLDRGSVLKGRVTDDRGNPISKAEVIVLSDGMREQFTRTEKVGEFKIERLPPGEVTALIRAEGYAPTGTKVCLPTKDPIHAVLHPGVSVTFLVSIETTGELRENIKKGALVLMDKKTAAPVGIIPVIAETRKEVRINTGEYDVLCWLGGEHFQVGSVEITGPGPVTIKVKNLGQKSARVTNSRVH